MSPVAGPAPGHVEGISQRLHQPQQRMFQFHDHAPSADLFVIESVIRKIDRPGRYAPFHQAFHPFGGVRGCEPRLDQGDQCVAVAVPVGIGREFRVRHGRTVQAHRFTELRPEFLRSHGDNQHLVTRPQGLVGSHGRMNIAQRLRAFAGGKEAAREVRQPGGLRIHERNVDESAAAGPVHPFIAGVESRQDADESVKAGRDVRHGRGKPDGRGRGVAGDGHEPGLALGDDVVAASPRLRSGMAVSADGGVDEARIQPAQRLGIDAGALERRHSRHVGDEYVGRLQQAKEQPVGLRLLDVQFQAALVSVDRQKVRAFALDKGRSPAARLVAPSRTFDLDDVRAHIPQEHGAVGPREGFGHFHDTQVSKRRV